MKALLFLKKHCVSIIFALCAVYIMFVIFSFSAQVGSESSQVSSGVSRTISEMIIKGFTSLTPSQQEAKIEALVPYVRKSAHFLVYCALGFFSLISTLSFLRENKKEIEFKKLFLPVFSFCSLYAASDEIHQLFVPERSGNILDVLLDSLGAFCGMLAALLAFSIFCKLKDKSTRKS